MNFQHTINKEDTMEFQTTLDRDVRLSPEQITVTTNALRKRRSELRRSIDKANEQRAAGVRIQHGTLDRHITELTQVELVMEALEVARQQIAHRLSTLVLGPES